MLQVIITILLSAFVAFALVIEFKRLKVRARLKHIPTAREFPFIGTRFILSMFDMAEFLRYFKEMYPAPIGKIFIGHKVAFVISDPETLKEIADSNACLDRPEHLKFWPYWRSIMSNRYHGWRSMRRAANPALNQKFSTNMIPVMNQHFERMVTDIEKNLPVYQVQPVDFFEIIKTTSFAQVMETIFKLPNAVGRFNTNNLDELLEICLIRLQKPILFPNIFYRFSSLKKRIDYLTAEVDRELLPLAHEMIENEKQNYTEEDCTLIGQLTRPMKDGGSLEFREVYDNIATMLIAAYETSSLGIAYAILMLAMHSDIDEKIYQEIVENISADEPLDQNVLKRLPYMDLVIKETLRLFPVGAVVPRTPTKDIHIKSIGLIEKDTPLMCIIYQLHRWKHIWGDDADEFKPERWLTPEVQNRHPMSYLPFGWGHRTCIGIHYATINVKLALIHLLRNFRFETDLKLSELTFRFAISLKLNNKHMVRIFPRESMKQSVNK